VCTIVLPRFVNILDVIHSFATNLSDNHDLNNTNIVNIHDARPKIDAERQAERYKRKRDRITAEEKAKKLNITGDIVYKNKKIIQIAIR
jgi:hypothetical protein